MQTPTLGQVRSETLSTSPFLKPFAELQVRPPSFVTLKLPMPENSTMQNRADAQLTASRPAPAFREPRPIGMGPAILVQCVAARLER